jgi:hypothetical protein
MLVSGKPDEHEARVRRFDGVYRWHLFRAVPLYDETGKLLKWYASAFDIEDRKRAEEALRRSESYLADAQRFIGAGSWAWNVATRQSVYWSQKTLSRSIIKSHGGRLWATSNSGPGATFQFTLRSEVPAHQAA